MPSISGPRSTVASSSAVTPFVSGAAFLLLIVLSSLYFPRPNVRPSTQDELISDTRSYLCRRERQPALVSRYLQEPHVA